MSRVRRILIGLVVFVLVLALALGGLVAFSVPRSFPETAGEIPGARAGWPGGNHPR